MFDPLNEEGVFTLHAEIDGSILATGNRVEISKIVTAFNLYGIRLDEFYVMEELEDEYHEQVLTSDFILLEEL